MIASMTIAQIMFKFAGNFARSQRGVLAFYANPYLWCGLFASFIGMLCWLVTLRKMPLAHAYPWTALIYVFTPLASIAIFNDVLHLSYLFGMICVVVGIFIIAKGNTR
jgi:drug/metabolite transporter (DMT)-like permease